MVVVSWDVNNGGSPITNFVVQIRESDGLTYTAESVACKSDDSTVLSTKSCTIPIPTLRAEPYSLPFGTSVYAKVTATNSYGTSVISAPGNGAVILTVPTAVVLSNYEAGTNADQITI